MNVAEASIRFRTVTLTLTAVLLAAGAWSYHRLGRLEDPEFTIKQAQVITPYPGASAEQVAREVTDLIERTAQQMGQLQRVKGMSVAGRSIVSVEMKDHFDKRSLPQVWDELRRKIGDAQRQLPPGAGPSVVNDDFGDVYGVYLAVYGDGYSLPELREHAKQLRRELLLVADVAKVSLFNEPQEVIYVEVSRARMARLGMSPDAVYAALEGQNLVVESGVAESGSMRLRIDPIGGIRRVEDLAGVLLNPGESGGARLTLGDVATISRETADPPESLMYFDGRPAVGLGVSTAEGGNVVTMGRAVKARIQELQSRTPVGIELGVISLQSDSVTTAIDSFVVSVVEAVLIVVGVLMLTMGLRSGLIIGFVLVLTVLGTFVVMDAQGVRLERISLGALIIALGMLVDNAIVVIEGVLVGIQKGEDRVKAASTVVGQTQWPLLGATAIAVLAFAAIGASNDSSGEFCRSLFLVILYSLGLSWVLAITVTPLLAVMFLHGAAAKPDAAAADAKPAPGGDPYAGTGYRLYRALLLWTLRHRAATLAALLMLLVAAGMGFGNVRQSFFPESTRPQMLVHLWLPQGTDLRATRDAALELDAAARRLDAVRDTAAVVGGGAPRFILTYSAEEPNTAYALLIVSLKDYRTLDAVAQSLLEHARLRLPDAQVFCRRFKLGPGDPQRVQVRFRGPDPDVLRALADQAREVFADEPLAADIVTDWRDRVPVLRPVISDAALRNAGLTRDDVARAFRTTTTGSPVGVFRDGDDLLPILARDPDARRRPLGPETLIDAQVYSPVARRAIPLAQVVVGQELASENPILRTRDRLPTITVKCDPAVGEASALFLKVRDAIEDRFASAVAQRSLEGYSLEWGGEHEDSAKANAALGGKLPPIGLFIALILIALFNNLRQPLVIALTVPLALIGVSAGLLLSGQPFGFMAMLGFLSLAGMLIKNAIVLIDEFNARRAQGDASLDAITVAGVSRLRPVSMAALTTVLGMLPLVIDPFFSAMAVTIMAGLSFATVLTLVIVPVLLSVLYRAGRPTG